MKSAGGYGAILSGALKDLNTYWEQTGSVWRDAAREKFENDHLRILAEGVRAASTAMDQIEVLLSQVRKECS